MQFREVILLFISKTKNPTVFLNSKTLILALEANNGPTTHLLWHYFSHFWSDERFSESYTPLDSVALEEAKRGEHLWKELPVRRWLRKL